MKRGLSLLVGWLAAAIAFSPTAQARTLDEIYQDILVQLPQKPCQMYVPANDQCRKSLTAKLNLTGEAVPLLQAMQPAPPRSPAANAFSAATSVANGYKDWQSSNCDGVPAAAARVTTCDGTYIQQMFDGFGHNVGFILQGLSVTP